MVREILQLSVGQCGNQIGKVFWQNILDEHFIDNEGHFVGAADDVRRVERLDVYMQESKHSKEAQLRYVPRSVLLDLEPGVIDSIRASPMGNLFAPEFMVHAVSGAGNNWAKGHYVAGAQIIDEAMDCVRKYVESCECLQGFQLTQALGGGTGSGFGTLVLNRLRDLYPDRISCTYSVYPAPKVSDIVVEPYNALLSISHLMETSDETFVIDNQSLIQISDKVLKQKSPSFEQLNWVISLIMSGVTASLRFSGLLNGDLRKMATNLIPFPRLHFFSCSYAPLFELNKGQYTKWSWRALTEDIWRDDHFLADIHQLDGKYLSCCVNYRGEADEMSSYDIDHTVQQLQQRDSDHFVSWIPHNVKTSMISVPSVHSDKCAALITNTTSIKSVFMRISAQFALLFKRRAFLHWYTNEGMDEMEFIDADAQIRDLIMEYQEKQDAIYMTPSPPTTDDEAFEEKMKQKTEEEKVQAYIERKLYKLQRQMDKEEKLKQLDEKNKSKSIFGNINKAKKRAPNFRAKIKPKRNPGGHAVKTKSRAAIVWSDDEEQDQLDEEQDELDEDEQEEEEEEAAYDENAAYDEQAQYDEHAVDEQYDENAQYDENYEEQPYDEQAYDENAQYDDANGQQEYAEEAYNEEYVDPMYQEPYDENYAGQYDENYNENDAAYYEQPEEEAEQAEYVEPAPTKKKKKKKEKTVEEQVEEELDFLNSDDDVD
mmetsp:Transcript_59532/g.94723  ORF Transcript_59532/g.94723 Transcript_59532/m.94723 type:complete len:711 (-) Transcript_59532:245-2377(-)